MKILTRKKNRIQWFCIALLFIILLFGKGTITYASEVIYFGSYPQSEVTDEAVIASIENAIKAEDEKVTEKTEGSDMGRSVWVDGIKYCRISADNTNRADNFGTDKTYHYFKWEPIKWKVLKNDGKTMVVVADQALDCKGYNENRQDVTWETSTIRSWLNGYDAGKNIESIGYSTDSFLENAFSQTEQKAIVKTKVENNSNAAYDTVGGNSTNDFIFLLSIEEVADAQYGFSDNADASSTSRQIKSTDFADARGVAESNSTDREGNCGWWLRSPGMYSYDAAYVNSSGYVNRVGLIVPYDDLGVCPALCVDLTSDIWNTEGDGNSGDGEKEQPGTDLQVTEEKTEEKTEENAEGKTEDTQSQQVPVTKLTIKAPSKKLAAGKKVQFIVSVSPASATNREVSWKTSNKKYATVNAKGKVTLKKAGIGKKVTITATAKDGSGKKASIKIKIMKNAVKRIKVTAPKKTLKAGKSMTLKTTVKTTGKHVNKTLKWKSSNTKFATVNNKGKVTAKKAGKGKTVTITAVSTDGSNKKASVKIKIK